MWRWKKGYVPLIKASTEETMLAARGSSCSRGRAGPPTSSLGFPASAKIQDGNRLGEHLCRMAVADGRASLLEEKLQLDEQLSSSAFLEAYPVFLAPDKPASSEYLSSAKI